MMQSINAHSMRVSAGKGENKQNTKKKVRVGLRWNNMNLLRVEDSELVGLVDPL